MIKRFRRQSNFSRITPYSHQLQKRMEQMDTQMEHLQNLKTKNGMEKMDWTKMMKKKGTTENTRRNLDN